MVTLEEYDFTLVSHFGDFALENFPVSESYIILLFMYVGAVDSASIQTDCGPQRPTRIFTEITLVYGRVIYIYIYIYIYVHTYTHTHIHTHTHIIWYNTRYAVLSILRVRVGTCVYVMRVRFKK